MNRKTVLIIAAIVVVLCLCIAVGSVILVRQLGAFASNTVSENPDTAIESLNNIVDFNAPEGLGQSFHMNLLGVTMVGFNLGSNDLSAMVIQFPASMQISQEQMAQQMQDAMSRQTGVGNLNLKTLGTLDRTIRGQAVTMILSEGSSSSGSAFRQLTGFFTGKNGQAMVSITGPTDSWDQTAVDRFLAALR